MGPFVEERGGPDAVQCISSENLKKIDVHVMSYSEGIDTYLFYFLLINVLNRCATVEVAIISCISSASSQDLSTPTTSKLFTPMLIFVTHPLLIFLYLLFSIKNKEFY